MSDDEEKSGSGFSVRDRRGSAESKDDKRSGFADVAPSSPNSNSDRDRPIQLDFSSFVVSIGTAAMVELGEIPSPVTGKKELNRQAACHNIEILEILFEKTKGNLSAAESALLNNLLYEVRMKFVAVKN